jgi:two-component system, cell cycle sensor histidine kinase and response regulator CckA
LEANESQNETHEHMQIIVEKGSDRFQSKHRRKDGTLFDVEVSIQLRKEEGGQCVCFLRDISERTG